MVIDTDILIWFFRGNLNAISALDEIPAGERFISTITYMELVQGMRNKIELKAFQEIFEYSELVTLPLSHEIGIIACQYLEQFHLTSGLRIEDALIASTASAHSMVLFSGNYKHFKDLKIPLKRFSIDQT